MSPVVIPANARMGRITFAPQLPVKPTINEAQNARRKVYSNAVAAILRRRCQSQGGRVLTGAPPQGRVYTGSLSRLHCHFCPLRRYSGGAVHPPCQALSQGVAFTIVGNSPR